MRQQVRTPHEISPETTKRISCLRRRLLCWFARNGRSFPWREPDRTPYEVVVAEILLQRTTAAGVARAYSGFLKRYPSWIALAHAPPESLENALMPLGLWRQLVRSKRGLEVNWAALDFGALVCRERHPLCPECPLRSKCHYAMGQLQPTSSAGVL